MNAGNFRVGTRLGGAFALLIVMMLAMSMFSMFNMAKLNSNTELLASEDVPTVLLSQDILNGVNDTARALRNALLVTDPDAVKAELQRVEKNQADNTAQFGKLDKYIDTDKEIAQYKLVTDARDKFLADQTEFLKLARDGKKDEAVQFLLTRVRKTQSVYINELKGLIKIEIDAIEEGKKEAEEAYAGTRNVTILCSLLAAVLAAAVVWWITRSITVPLNEAVAVAQRVAGGDLTTEIEVTSRDETGQLMAALKDMNARLTAIVAEVRVATETIATASGQIASGNMDLSSRTEEQAGTLEETASSMEELTSTVKQNADNAGQANQLARAASEVASKGGSVVSEVVGTMGAINDSSKKIVDIIAVIDGIAFQTNILALNAAVEAARAGEQGRGFAVVASEVRSLAQRSASAAKEIKSLIGDSVDKVAVGAKLVDQAGATMQEVVDSIKRVTDMMSEIAAASHEQTQGIEQVNQAIIQMDDTTQRNASLVEEAAAASQALQDQATRLAQLVGIFKINEIRAAGASVAQQARPTHAAPVTPMAQAPRASLPKKQPLSLRSAQSRAVAKAAPAAESDWEEF
jgi:methyl-accepting chemotaxis protein